MKYLLVEDDCAPDAAQYFGEKFSEITGKSLSQRLKIAGKATFDDTVQYISDDHILEFSADWPQYRLSKNNK